LRLSKEVLLYFAYSESMGIVICASMTVDQVLKEHPDKATTFLALRTSCVGCHLARFCTLEDVAQAYELPLQELIDKLSLSELLSAA
jgi:hybrid cluster-associated redox disulfide protein